MSQRIKVTLKWIQILDNLEPFFKEKGEFRFRSKVSSDNRGGIVHETQFPETGYWSISDHPAWNKRHLADRVLFEGEVDDHLVIELFGEELDDFSANDELDHYRRDFTGDVNSWMGRYGPGEDTPDDQETDDPEAMSNWRICYHIDPA